MATNMDETELKLTLLSLACGPAGTRVLVKEPRGAKEVLETDVFKFNEEFTSKLYRVKINTIQVRACLYMSVSLTDSVCVCMCMYLYA